MRVDPAIAALRGDRAPQRQAQTAIAAACRNWRQEPGAREAMAELEAFGSGAGLDECPALSALLRDPETGQRLIAQLCSLLVGAMRDNPFGHPPFRHGFDGLAGTLLLARSGRAQLMLQSREPGSYSHSSAAYSRTERHELVLAGHGSAVLVRAGKPRGGKVTLRRGGLDLLPDTTLSLDLSRDCLLVEEVETRLVILRLVRDNEVAGLVREYDLETGRFLHQSAGDLGTSHKESMVALLGRMGRVDAAPLLARIALGEADASLRWQAMRECLALDTAEGFCALVRLARDAADPLAADSGALRAQLLEAHPQLLEWEKTECPA